MALIDGIYIKQLYLLRVMNPDEVALCIQLWVDKNPTLSMTNIKHMVVKMMSVRWFVDKFQRMVIDRGLDMQTGSPKEGYSIKVVFNTIEEWKLQFINAEISLPKLKAARTLVGSSIDDREKVLVTDILLEQYNTH